jgi:hypothetical protein
MPAHIPSQAKTKGTSAVKKGHILSSRAAWHPFLLCLLARFRGPSGRADLRKVLKNRWSISGLSPGSRLYLTPIFPDSPCGWGRKCFLARHDLRTSLTNDWTTSSLSVLSLLALSQKCSIQHRDRSARHGWCSQEQRMQDVHPAAREGILYTVTNLPSSGALSRLPNSSKLVR